MSITELEIGNYRGNLLVKRDGKPEDMKFYWTVDCDLENREDLEWKEIPDRLYFAIITHHDKIVRAE